MKSFCLELTALKSLDYLKPISQSRWASALRQGPDHHRHFRAQYLGAGPCRLQDAPGQGRGNGNGEHHGCLSTLRASEKRNASLLQVRRGPKANICQQVRGTNRPWARLRGTLTLRTRSRGSAPVIVSSSSTSSSRPVHNKALPPWRTRSLMPVIPLHANIHPVP